MANYTYNSNVVPSDPAQFFTLNVTFDNGVISWSVVPKRQDGQTGNVVRNNIYGLTVNIGGNSYNKGDIPWGNYYVGSSIYSGTTQLSACTVVDGLVAIGLTGNYYYGTWNSTYTCRISSSLVVVSPTVTLPTYSATNTFSNRNLIVAGYSTITFSCRATVGTEGNTIVGYRLYQDDVMVVETTSVHGLYTVAPVGGGHTYYVVAIESNGATGKSAGVLVTTVDYTPPSFVSVLSTRWSSSSSSGEASDDGTHAKLTATYNKAKVGSYDVTTTKCRVKIGTTVIGVITNSGDSLYTDDNLTLSPDSSYEVVYELYDSVTGETSYSYTLDTAPVTLPDVITIGKRGLDLFYDVQDGYGVAFGKKAVSGYVDSALPIRIQTIDASGNVTEEAKLESTPTEITSPVTRTSGAATSFTATLHIWGRVAMLTIVLQHGSSLAAWGYYFRGKILDEYKPVSVCHTHSSWYEHQILGSLEADGSIIIQDASGTSSAFNSGTATISFTYIF